MSKAAPGNASEDNGPESLELLTTQEVANLWRVPKWWVEEQARKGGLVQVWVGKHRRFASADLARFIRQQRQGGGTQPRQERNE